MRDSVLGHVSMGGNTFRNLVAGVQVDDATAQIDDKIM
ncbi:hypothetical protein URH17368_0106 [Alicyclobacillus hesperidum URH17-3-68]|nr:hypothetical protein URH17368_0106 [Alicyclobacillus hesperidum URH17-3-68]